MSDSYGYIYAVYTIQYILESNDMYIHIKFTDEDIYKCGYILEQVNMETKHNVADWLISKANQFGSLSVAIELYKALKMENQDERKTDESGTNC